MDISFIISIDIWFACYSMGMVLELDDPFIPFGFDE